MSWKRGRGIDGEAVESVPKRNKEETAADRYLKLCVKIHNFYERLEVILIEKTRDEREKEGIRRCINELRRAFGDELRYVLGRMH